jgi:PIN domain nuclease of toxin-antitoxin system
MQVSVADAKNKLPELIKAVEAGEAGHHLPPRRTGGRSGSNAGRGSGTTEVRDHERQDRRQRSGLVEADDGRRGGRVPGRALLTLRLLVDTATFIWALQSPERISARALSALRDDGVTRELSAVLITEMAIKTSRGKLGIHREDILVGLADLRMQVLPWNARHAFKLFELPLHHSDPIDRQILAQALAERYRL